MARIGINALYLIPGGVGGTEIYLRRLLAALASIDRENEYFVFTNRETTDEDFPSARMLTHGGSTEPRPSGSGQADSLLVPVQANFHARPQAVRASFRPARILWEQIVLPFRAARLDVLLNPGFTSPVLAPCPCVTVFHDLQHAHHPEYFRWFDLPFWKLLLWASAHRARRLIAVSQATRTDLVRVYGLPADRIDVVLHGVEPEFFALDRTRMEPFVLCVSTLHPHKNLDRLIRAYARRKRSWRLVIAGMRGFFADTLDALIKELGVRDSVRLTGWIPREELLQLYGRALAFVYPSTFEGFGMPVLEAMAHQVPVITSNVSALPEVAGDAALLVNPADTEALSEALTRLASDESLRQDLIRRGTERAREFTWESAVESTWALYNEMT
jgi:glycosyltransferase involved in cell wall biosynthesis